MSEYGTDFGGTDDLELDRRVSGGTLVGQAVWRRLRTRRGALGGFPNYGTDLADLIYDDMDQAAIARVPTVVRSEVMKDPRIRVCNVGASWSPQTASSEAAMTITIDCRLADGAAGFRLVVAATSVTAELQRLEAR
uniref:Putative baseplate wedge subunit n=1 Tax=viral metagenome TaxID=1070528 RepID=A0A6M3INT7_9ZZZZ